MLCIFFPRMYLVSNGIMFKILLSIKFNIFFKENLNLCLSHCKDYPLLINSILVGHVMITKWLKFDFHLYKKIVCFCLSKIQNVLFFVQIFNASSWLLTWQMECHVIITHMDILDYISSITSFSFLFSVLE